MCRMWVEVLPVDVSPTSDLLETLAGEPDGASGKGNWCCKLNVNLAFRENLQFLNLAFREKRQFLNRAFRDFALAFSSAI